MKDYKGKKLLIIGANAFFLDVLKFCRERGIITIILDDNPKAVSKLYADIALNIDTYNKDAVLEVAQTYKIDGVFVGWSDHNLYTARYVADKMGLPFYATRKQLDYTTNKRRFKDLCIKNAVPVLPDIEIEDNNIDDIKQYPFIVKPTDSAGSKGITICYNKQELLDAYQMAKESSFTNTALIEKAVDYKHISVYYTLVDGEIYLSSMCDRKVHYIDPAYPPLPALLVHPSQYLQIYIEKVDKTVQEMFQSIGMRDGLAFVQACIDEKTETIYIYEMGYRLNGGSTYFLIDFFEHYNQMEMLIHYALFGNMGDIANLKKASPSHKGIGHMIVLSIKQGNIKEIKGIKEIEQLEDVIHILPMYREGECVKVISGVSHAHIFGYVYLAEIKKSNIKSILCFIKEHLQVISDNGENMLIDTWDACE